jgi:uncharacterized protein
VIPNFPLSKNLEICDRSDINNIISSYPPYSDFNFSSLFSWNVAENARISMLNNNLVIKFSDYGTGSDFYTLIGENDIDDTLMILLDFAKNTGVIETLSLVPESVVKEIKSTNLFIVSEDINNHDYIYKTTDLINLESYTYRRKRYLINSYNRNYGHCTEYSQVELGSEDIIKEIRRINSLWVEIRDKKMSDIETEITAINRYLNHNELLESKCFVMILEKVVIGYVMFEVLHNRVANIHFSKCDTTISGVSESLYHNLAKHLNSIGIDYFNLEQDLGIEGLRKSKLSYRPSHFLKKYQVRLLDRPT